MTERRVECRWDPTPGGPGDHSDLLCFMLSPLIRSPSRGTSVESMQAGAYWLRHGILRGRKLRWAMSTVEPGLHGDDEAIDVRLDDGLTSQLTRGTLPKKCRRQCSRSLCGFKQDASRRRKVDGEVDRSKLPLRGRKARQGDGQGDEVKAGK